MSKEIADAWSRLMSGSEVDVEAFTNVVLECALRTGGVSGTVTDRSTVEFAEPSDTSAISQEAVSSKFRMVCARLATIFGGATQDPPVLYGGLLAGQLRVDGRLCEGELEFKNAADGWFRLRLARAAAGP